MKKNTTILFSISLCALISMLAISPAQAYIEKFTWLPPYMKKGYDSYYGEYVVIYKDGSDVNFIVPVENDWYLNGLNVSKVIVSFDWGQNKTLDLSTNIEQVGWHETEIFTVSFTASATEAISSDWAHEYTIYVEHVNATTGPTETVGTWSRPWDWWSPDYLFVVFPTDQADAYDSSQEYDAYASAYPSWTFSNINASQLAGQATIEASLGNIYYTRGDYTSAETQYQTALDLYNQALAAEATWETKVEEANLEIALTEAEANMATANAMLRQADAAVNQSYSWILFGIGFVFMGIATIVYASRKPQVG
ncbi:MAG: tetratricopeptide repeat protein [Candidatus Bathyarchaeota archaeon]|jgi:tetratricopeptide (TPR) repeat protein|nr:tetratricopeptide repeat protein [Candidatus Bathyarchaeota archaeon]